MTVNYLPAAIHAYKNGNRGTARRLVNRELAQNPNNIRAWTWACELAESRDEKIRCLEEILLRTPEDKDARRYLDKLTLGPAVQSAPKPGAPPTATTPSTDDQTEQRRVGWLAAGMQLMALALVLVVIVACVSAITQSSWLGLRGPDFESLIISDTFEHIESDDYMWQIVYENRRDTEFAGVVRHTSPIHEGKFRILTHDILITSGEFADPDIVDTSVSNHRFRWYSQSKQHPQGRLNLLHTLAADDEILTQLKEIEKWDQVVVSGREVLRVELYDLEGNYIGNWHDTGCNTLVVTSVSILEK